ncbi:HAD family hydrolase [Thermocrinis minervae]|uniref:phosphoglycolate phosphatase n=1 Tax=Thermocrinis minervae TaxID=381751 RepID=A0A1M6QTG1_9AQUI|nr:HAD family hydrolase [Thermocrinis minervae]SHK23514.1 HAD superfamily phosphatase [Thermocrinis minervae]
MKATIFDVDGVIVDVKESYHHAIARTASYFLGFPVDVELARRIKFEKGINNDWLATLEVIRHFGKDAKLEEVIQVFNREYVNVRDKERLILSRPFFEGLKSMGVMLGVVTGRPREDLDYVFRRFSLWDLFDCVVDDDTIEDPSLKKPHPYALYLCIESLKANSAVYIGDSLADWRMVEDFKKVYPQKVEYVHFGDSVKLDGVLYAKDEKDLYSTLQEVLRNL